MQEQETQVMPQESKETVTEVTSIADEEKKTGQKINIPSPEELVARASASLLTHRRYIEPIFGELSKKATLRVLYALFDVPQDGVPVKFKSEQEKQAFYIGQNMIRDIFLIMQHHIYQKRKEIAEEVAKDQQDLENKANEESTTTQVENNTQTKETTNE